LLLKTAAHCGWKPTGVVRQGQVAEGQENPKNWTTRESPAEVVRAAHEWGKTGETKQRMYN